MTDEHPESPEIEAVRRLLADARHTEPMPDDVIARLDRALADLKQEPGDESTATVVPLGDSQEIDRQRRRRRAAGLLVAAAVIVVGGFVAAQNLPGSGPNTPAGGSAGSAAEGSARSTAGAGTGPEARVPRTSDGAVVVHPERLAATALAARRELETLASRPHAARRYDLAQSSCVPTPRHGKVVRAVYRRAPAALVYHRPVDGSQDVDLVVCGSSRPIRSVTLPAP